MTPFQEFRFWMRRAPAHQLIGSTVAALIVIALVGWLLVPDDDDDETALQTGSGPAEAVTGSTPEGAAPTTLPGAPVEGGTDAGAGGGAVSTGSGAPAAGSAAVTGAAGGSEGCQSPPASGKGVTATEIKVAVALTRIQIGGADANGLFNVPPPDVAKADFQAAFNGVNKEGGAACRKLVPTYYEINPTDEPGMLAQCRDFADKGFFAVIDTGGMATRPAVVSCMGQLKVPFLAGFFITETDRQRFFPNLYSFYTKEQLYRSTVVGLKQVGYFDPAKGFKKLGFIYRDCEKDAINAFRNWIREAVPDSQVVTYNVGCPQIFAREDQINQAVLTFDGENVTHVMAGNFQGDLAAFTRRAEAQQFRPQYGLPNEGLLSIAKGAQAPNPDNIANAIAIAINRDGEDTTPGMTPTAGTQKCNAYRKAAGLPPVYGQPANAGHTCDQVWMLQYALNNAPQVSQAALQAGLQRAGSIDWSYPQGPNDFRAARVTTGGQFWRVTQFKRPECSCWRVIDPEFKRGF
jgi:hypothetical protein